MLDPVDETALQVRGLAELDSPQPGQQLTEEVAQLRSGQLVAQAEMRSTATETEMRVGRSCHIERVRRVERAVVAVRRTIEQPELVPGLDLGSGNLGVGG